MVDNSNANRPRVNATLATLKRFQSNPLALWRGYTALAGRNLPMTAIQFPMFERVREYIKRYRNEKGTRTGTIYESGWITAVSAGSAGSVAAVITTPVDVVKTRIMLAAAESAAADQGPVKTQTQAQGKDGLVDATGKTVKAAKESLKEKVKNVTKPVSNKGSIEIAKEIMAESGVKGLFRGGALRGVWTLMGAGLYLGVYESGRIYLAGRRGEQLDEEDLM
jgi:solute carrier family 25 S-adenosylmethionine transporter 26